MPWPPSQGAALQERVSDMEVALLALESVCEQRCSQATAAASAEIKFVEAEKLNIQSSLFAAQADIATMNQLKLQVQMKYVTICPTALISPSADLT
jgi:hypothetical protein